MIRRDALFLVGEQHRFALGAHQHFVLGLLEVEHQDLLPVIARRIQRCLVDHVGQIGAGEARCSTSQNAKIDVVGNRHLAGVHAENLFASAHVRTSDNNTAIEAARPQQRRIENVGPVRRGDQNHAVVGLKAVHFDQQLIQGLLALVVSAAEAGAAMASNRVNFVDEDDAGSILLALLEQIADAARTDADEHLDEVRTGDGEERDIGLAGDRAGQQSFAGSRRSDEQHALGDAPAQLLEFLRLAQELDNLLQLFLGFVDTGHILKRDLLLLHREQPGAALAERQRLIAAALHLPDHEEPQQGDQNQRGELQQPAPPAVAVGVLHCDADLVLVEDVVEVRIVRGNDDAEGAFVGAEVSSNVLAGDRDVVDLVRILRLPGTGRRRFPVSWPPIAPFFWNNCQSTRRQAMISTQNRICLTVEFTLGKPLSFHSVSRPATCPELTEKTRPRVSPNN